MWASPSALASVLVRGLQGADLGERQGFHRPESRRLSKERRKPEAWSWTLGSLDSASKSGSQCLEADLGSRGHWWGERLGFILSWVNEPGNPAFLTHLSSQTLGQESWQVPRAGEERKRLGVLGSLRSKFPHPEASNQKNFTSEPLYIGAVFSWLCSGSQQCPDKTLLQPALVPVRQLGTDSSVPRMCSQSCCQG